jgi:POT family proton-dependent oligopeptide transporter
VTAFLKPCSWTSGRIVRIVFTEMWSCFSYYGMRALLCIDLACGGWAWSIEDVMALYGTYTMSVYFTPVIEGFMIVI